MRYWFTADEHYGHKNIIKYCSRPFQSVEEMDNFIISAHNEVVEDDDRVIHIGDFTLQKKADKYLYRLNGKHTFLMGSHDRWLDHTAPYIWERKIQGQWVVCCHYAMRTWGRSHHGSWQLFGHSHGTLKPQGNQIDVGVDTHGFKPYSFEEIKEVLG